MDLSGKHIELSVLFDMVRIEIHCGDDYEAQVVFDDLADTLKAGGKVELVLNKYKLTDERR